MICLSHGSSQADTISVAVAANVAPTLRSLAQQFERQSPHKVHVISGSSGLLAAKIRHGAPYDVFYSADAHKPQALIDAGLAAADKRYHYATGRLILWSSQRAAKDTSPCQGDASACLAALKHTLRRPFKHLALANPRLAPYGQAAVETLTALNLLSATRHRWVMAENITQTHQFVASGNAQWGFIARAQWQAMANAGQGLLVPKALHRPIRQEAILLNDTAASRAFWQFAQSAPGRDYFQRDGYEVPERLP